MDKEQEELQFLGFFGIIKESFTIVPAWRPIFSQISLALIFPLSFIYLAHIQISYYLSSNIHANEDILNGIPEGAPKYNSISEVLSSEWTIFLLFKIGYFVFFLVLALLSTSAVVYTIACIYTAKDITFKKVMSVVPKVWKRLMVTFIWNFIIVFAYNVVIVVLASFIFVLISPRGLFLWLFFIVLGVAYLAGLVYISVIWHLATVVSVLEEKYGLNAIIKSQDLIQGKLGISVVIFILFSLLFFGIQIGFVWLVVFDEGAIIFRFGYGALCLTLLSMLMLFGLITETIIYFVCKSYHHENIDKSSLADHLEVYLGEYVPLKSKDVQLEHFDV